MQLLNKGNTSAETQSDSSTCQIRGYRANIHFTHQLEHYNAHITMTLIGNNYDKFVKIIFMLNVTLGFLTMAAGSAIVK